MELEADCSGITEILERSKLYKAHIPSITFNVIGQRQWSAMQSIWLSS